MKTKMKNSSHHSLYRPMPNTRPNHGNKYINNINLSTMILKYIKQHLNNIWRLINEKVKQQWGWPEKNVAYKKARISLSISPDPTRYDCMRFPIRFLWFIYSSLRRTGALWRSNPVQSGEAVWIRIIQIIIHRGLFYRDKWRMICQFHYYRPQRMQCEKSPHSEFFWFVFFRIWTE